MAKSEIIIVFILAVVLFAAAYSSMAPPMEVGECSNTVADGSGHRHVWCYGESFTEEYCHGGACHSHPIEGRSAKEGSAGHMHVLY